MNKKHTPPFKIDMGLEEALERFSQVDPNELKPEQEDKIRLVEDDTGHRVLVYTTENGVGIDLRFEGDTFWATQKQMAEMFGVTTQNITQHLANIFSEGELIEDSVCKESLHTGSDGKQYKTKLYDLNAVISVGYRVKSKLGTMFRVWATDKLFQILTKGFYLDKKRLKNPEQPDIIDELREQAYEIRASTRNAYREVRRLCSLCSDYDPGSQESREFYACMENKLLWASTSMTAPEIIMTRADASEPDMGLICYEGKRVPTQRDVTIANNYLAEPEANTKNRATVMWLDYVISQLELGKMVTMGEVREKLDGFIKFNGWPVLEHYGKVTRKSADAHAKQQLKLYKQLLAEI